MKTNLSFVVKNIARQLQWQKYICLPAFLFLTIMNVSGQGSGSELNTPAGNPNTLYTGNNGSKISVVADIGGNKGATTSLGANYATVTCSGAGPGWATPDAAYVPLGLGVSTTGYVAVSVDVYSPIEIPSFRMNFILGGVEEYNSPTYTIPAGKWTRVTRELPNNATLGRITFLTPTGKDAGGNYTYYFDNIYLLNELPVLPKPTTVPVATAPKAGNVLQSIYGYYGSPGNLIGWGTLGETILSGGKVLGTGTGAWDAISLNGIDMPTGTEYVYLDVWSATATTLKTKFIIGSSWVSSTEVSTALNRTTESWQQYKIAISQYNIGANPLQAFQIELGDGTYVGNVYFYTEKMPASPTVFSKLTTPVSIWSTKSGQGSAPGSSFTNVNTDSQNSNLRYFTLGTTRARLNMTALNVKGTNGNNNYISFDVYADNVPTNDLIVQITNSGVPATLTFTTPRSLIIKEGWTTLNFNIDPATIGNITRVDIYSATNTGANLWVDNFVAHYTEANTGAVAELYQGTTLVGQHTQIKTAVEAAAALVGDISIAVIDDSKEPEQIVMNALPVWTTLTIYPKNGTRTISYTGSSSIWGNNSLFRIDVDLKANNKIFTINGTLDGVDGGTPQSLVLKSKLATTAADDRNTVLLLLENASGVTVKNCMFEGMGTERPKTMIFSLCNDRGDITIKDNHFKDAIYLGETLGYMRYGLVHFDNRPKNVIIDGNHFYETAQVDFTSESTRAFIVSTYKGTDTSVTSDFGIQIINNVIGGNAPNAAGLMKYGSSSTACKSVDLWAISVYSGTTPNHPFLIENNTVANIEMYNPTGSGQYDGDGIMQQDATATLVGIAEENSIAIVRGNTIRNLTNNVHANSNEEPMLLKGIYCSARYESNNYICENNDISDLKAVYISPSTQNPQIGGIQAVTRNLSNGGETAESIIRGNRIVLKQNNLGGNLIPAGYPVYSCIRATPLNVTAASQPIVMDIYNNICVLTGAEFALSDDAKALNYTIALIEIEANAYSTVNCFNNIAYVEPETSTSFSNTVSSIYGIKAAVQANGTTNIFHNTSFIKDLKNSGKSFTAPLFISAYMTDYGTNSKVNVYNNNLVNLNGTNGSVLNFGGFEFSKGTVCKFDYNNYYIPVKDKFITFDYHGDIYRPIYQSLDDWKFSNSNFAKGSEQEFHSRFLNPEFVSSVDLGPANLTPVGVTALRNNLKPRYFLGAAALPTAVSGATIESGTATKDAVGTARRSALPTIGAVNTAFTNYWNGNIFVNGGPNASNSDPGLRDIVFGEDVTGNISFTAGANISVHDIYNDTPNQIIVGNANLSISGYVGLVGSGKINAAATASTVIYSGNNGIAGVDNPSRNGAAAQHIFPNTFVNNEVYNLSLNNNSEYFVLLHDQLNILNDFSVRNANTDERTYPANDNITKGRHLGGLNTTWYNTTLTFTATAATTNNPVVAYNAGTPYTYRPYAGQRIPRHGLFNDEVYNLVCASQKLITYHDYLHIRNNFTINSGKVFEISADKHVEVEGITTNNGGTGGLVIKSRQLDTAETLLNAYLFPVNPRPNATFIYQSATQGQAEINATVEMYSPASLYSTEQESSSGLKYQNAWQYFVPGVRSVNKSNFATGSMYQYNYKGDNTAKYTNGSPYWVPPAATLDITKGYTITQNNPVVYTMAGTLPNDTYTIPASELSYYIFNPDNNAEINKLWPDDDATNQGQFLIGNPFTHAMSIEDLSFPGNFEKTVYIYNTGSFVEGNNAGGGSTGYFGDQPGENIVVPIHQAGQVVGGKTLPTTIPSMQGFTIKFLDGTYTHGAAATGSFSSEYITDKTPRITDGKNTGLQRSATLPKDTCKLYIQLKNGDYYDEILLVGYEGTGKGFDNGWDGKKTLNAARALSLFTIEQEEDMSTSYYQISTMDDLDKTELGIIIGGNEELRSAMDSQCELVLSGYNLDKFYSQIYLEDLKTGDLVDLLQENSVYSFLPEISGEVEKRFRIITAPLETTDIDSGHINHEDFEVYNQDKTIYIRNPKELPGTISLYDLAGRCILNREIKGSPATTIETKLVTGAYILKISAADTLINKTIILK